MLFIIIAAAIFVMWEVYIFSDRWSEWPERIWWSIVAAFITGTGLMLLIFIFGYSLPKTNHYERVDIVSLQDGSSIEGGFFLGTGYIDGSMKYSFYEKSGEGFKLTQVDSKDTIVYQSKEKPYAMRESGCDGNWQWIAPCLYDSDIVTEIHVPAGSIKENFVLDTE